jgi:hypothetical protein
MSKAELGALHKWHAWDTWSWAWQWGLCKANISQQEHDAPQSQLVIWRTMQESGEHVFCCLGNLWTFALRSFFFRFILTIVGCLVQRPERRLRAGALDHTLTYELGDTHKVRFTRPICPMISVHHTRSIYYFKTKTESQKEPNANNFVNKPTFTGLQDLYFESFQFSFTGGTCTLTHI